MNTNGEDDVPLGAAEPPSAAVDKDGVEEQEEERGAEEPEEPERVAEECPAEVGEVPELAEDLKVKGKLEVEAKEMEIEEEGENGSDAGSETEEATTVIDAVEPLPELDPFKEIEDEEELQRLSEVINTWSTGLKKHLASEFEVAKERLCAVSRGAVSADRWRLAERERYLCAQLSQLRDELSATRQQLSRKDRIIQRLGEEVVRQKARVVLAKSFVDWRVHQERERRKKFCTKLALRHHRLALQKRVFRAWEGRLQQTLTAHLEKRSRTRAEEVCVRLAAEHEGRVRELNEQLLSYRVKCEAALAAQSTMREEVWAALARGVSSLELPSASAPCPQRELHGAEELAAGAAADEEMAMEQKEEEDDRATYTLSEDSCERVVIPSAPQRRVTTGIVLRSHCGLPEAAGPPRARYVGPAVGSGAVFYQELPPGCHRPIAGQEIFEPPPPPTHVSRHRTRSPVASVLVERQHAVHKRTVGPVLHSASSRRIRT